MCFAVLVDVLRCNCRGYPQLAQNGAFGCFQKSNITLLDGGYPIFAHRSFVVGNSYTIDALRFAHAKGCTRKIGRSKTYENLRPFRAASYLAARQMCSFCLVCLP